MRKTFLLPYFEDRVREVACAACSVGQGFLMSELMSHPPTALVAPIEHNNKTHSNTKPNLQLQACSALSLNPLSHPLIHWLLYFKLNLPFTFPRESEQTSDLIQISESSARIRTYDFYKDCNQQTEPFLIQPLGTDKAIFIYHYLFFY